MKELILPGFCKELFAKQNRAKLAVALGAAAMVLILLSELIPPPSAPTVSTPENAPTAAQYKQQLEQQLETFIGQVEGAGKTTVMLTLESGEETIYALDTRRHRAGRDDLPAHGLRRCCRLRGRGRRPGGGPHHRAGGRAAGCAHQPHLRGTAGPLSALCPNSETRKGGTQG